MMILLNMFNKLLLDFFYYMLLLLFGLVLFFLSVFVHSFFRNTV